MPNHWHMVFWPRADGELTAFVRWLTHTHTMRWHAHYHTAGTGHLYQGRFKSFPVQSDEHFLTVCRYVERNPVRAGLVAQPRSWPWSRARGRASAQSVPPELALAEWPIHVPPDWEQFVCTPLTERELEACRLSVARGRPFGSRGW